MHGAAVAEIVHEMAPDAALYLASFSTITEMSACVTWLQSQGVKVINLSAGDRRLWAREWNGLQQRHRHRRGSSGITWVNAAGNEAESHWRNGWGDSDADNYQNFSGIDETQTITLPAGYGAQILLKWNDPYGASCNDYDLLVFDNLLNLSSVRIATQDCTIDPVEGVAFTTPYSGTYNIAIGRYSASGTSSVQPLREVHGTDGIQHRQVIV